MTIGESALNSPLISTLTKKSHKNSWSVLDAHRAPGKHIERFTKILICNHQLDLLLWFKDLQNMNVKNNMKGRRKISFDSMNLLFKLFW